MIRTTSGNCGHGLSVLAKGKGLLNGGVEVECIPDYRHNCSLSGNEFTTKSYSVRGNYAKVYKPYSLVLPKTYVTRRGQMVLFTAPDDMIIGKRLQTKIDHVSETAVKELKTVSTLHDTAINYEESILNDDNDMKPGCFTSVYLEKLRSTTTKPKMETKKNEVTPHDILVTESDSGIDSSFSHQTLNTSGRISTMSNRTDSTIVIPDDTLPRQPLEVRFNESISNQCDTVTALPGDGGKCNNDVITTDEISNIIFSIPKPKTDTINKGINKKKKVKKKCVGGKTGGKTSTSVGGQTPIKASVQENPTSNNSCTKKKGKVKKKSKKVQRDHQEDAIMDTNQENDVMDAGHQQTIETAIEIMDTTTTTEEERKEVSNVSSVEHRKSLQSARAAERRLMIEKKRLEKELLEQKRKEEERQIELKQLQQTANNNNTNSIDQSPEYITTTMQQQEQLPLVQEQLPLHNLTIQTHDDTIQNDIIELTDSERRLREAIERTRETRLKNRLLAAQQQKEEASTATESTDSHREETRQVIIPAKQLGKKEINYKLQLELLTNRQNQRITQSNVFSYFSYLPPPPKKTANNKKKSKSTAVKRR